MATDQGTSHIAVAGMIQSVGSPVIGLFGGEPRRVKVWPRGGLVYVAAEWGSGKTTGESKLDFEDSYGRFAHIHVNLPGPLAVKIRHRVAMGSATPRPAPRDKGAVSKPLETAELIHVKAGGRRAAIITS